MAEEHSQLGLWGRRIAGIFPLFSFSLLFFFHLFAVSSSFILPHIIRSRCRRRVGCSIHSFSFFSFSLLIVTSNTQHNTNKLLAWIAERWAEANERQTTKKVCGVWLRFEWKKRDSSRLKNRNPSFILLQSHRRGVTAGEKDQYCEVSNVSVFVFFIINRNKSSIFSPPDTPGAHPRRREWLRIFLCHLQSSLIIIIQGKQGLEESRSLGRSVGWRVIMDRVWWSDFLYQIAVCFCVFGSLSSSSARKMMMMMKKNTASEEQEERWEVDVHNACALVVKFQFSQGCELWRFINLTRMSIQGVNENV